VNQQIRRLATFGVIMLVALVVGTTYWQTWAAPGLADRQDNAIERVAQFTIERGRILAADGTVLARNRERRVKGKTFYFRRYPQGKPFAHIVGYSTQVRSRAGLERSLNDYLTASNQNLATVLERTKDELTGATIQGNDVHLTIDTRAQRVAYQALGRNCGGVAALDPQTGRILVLASTPSYDPNLVETNFRAAQRVRGVRCSRPDPFVSRATDGLYTPGSTYKVITAAAALDTGEVQLDTTFRDPGYCIEYGKRVYNYSDQGVPSGYGTVNLLQAIQSSINSVFCNIGKEIGAGAILEYSKRFGFYEKPPIDTPANERQASGLYNKGEVWYPDDPDGQVDPGRLAFGQERLQVTPLQMAMVAGALANDGVLMRPFLVDRIVAPNGKVISTTKPDTIRRVVSANAADAVTEGMLAAVRSGTSTRAQIGGVDVAGKTGTAEIGRDVNTTGFIAFAPAEGPRLAIAVFLEEQDGVGGSTAAPVAKVVMEALLRRPSN
jgi:peptidoglycan glycosyltransferase